MEASIILRKYEFHIFSPLVPASLLGNSCCCRVSSSGPALHLLAWGEEKTECHRSIVLEYLSKTDIHLFVSSACVTNTDALTLVERKTAKEKEHKKYISFSETDYTI